MVTPGPRGLRDGTREREFGGAGAQGWSHPGPDPWVQGDEDRGALALGRARVERRLQLGQIQLQHVGWGAVPKGVGRGRVHRPVWLYHEALVLLQGQGLQGKCREGRLLSPHPARLLRTPDLRSPQLRGAFSPITQGSEETCPRSHSKSRGLVSMERG